MNALTAQSIDVRVVAFEKDTQRMAAVEAAYENVVVCRDVRELPLLLGDWYAELSELLTAPVMQPNSAAAKAGHCPVGAFEHILLPAVVGNKR